ncbi:large ribosomal subunit protein mL55 [Ambystoma mexicanum]|uniref:large ribosomal subunit protein mL55 n=1 Tax=Ambystoma mexicanum TaxID=8296 RepID=UPI0037E6FAEA
MATTGIGMVGVCRQIRFLQQLVMKSFLPVTCSLHSSPCQHNSNRTSIVRCGKPIYHRTYPVLLVQPDGSTITIRYKEPRRVLVMPVDITTLSEAERRARFRKRNPKRFQPNEDQEEFKDEFNVDDYSKFWKKE